MSYLPEACDGCDSRSGLKVMPNGSAYCTNCNEWSRVWDD